MNVSDSSSTADTRLLAEYLRPERKPLSALVALLVVAMVLPLAGPLIIGWFVNAVTVVIAGQVISNRRNRQVA